MHILNEIATACEKTSAVARRRPGGVCGDFPFRQFYECTYGRVAMPNRPPPTCCDEGVACAVLWRGALERIGCNAHAGHLSSSLLGSFARASISRLFACSRKPSKLLK